MKLFRIILSAVFLLAAWLITRNGSFALWQQLLIFLVPYLIAGYDVLIEAGEGIAEGDPFDEDFLMSLATIGALLIGFMPGAEPQMMEAVFVMLFFQVGELFEDYAEDRTRDSIAQMMDLRPDTATVERGGTTETVDPTTVAVGETVVVRPGEKIPMDGEVVGGSSSLNTVALTGESMPRTVSVGDAVVSGCVNISGLLRVKVQKTFGESTASKIIKLVEDAGEQKSRSEHFITRFARVYTPIVVVAALVLAFVPPLFYASYGDAFATWLYRALTFLVVSCPCALVISIPLTFFAGIGGASRKGILIKGGNYMDVLAHLQTVVFDKTGTLTEGSFNVECVHPEEIGEQELLHLAAHVEHYSTHPIAAALRQAYPAGDTDDCRVAQVEELAGKGVTAMVNGRRVAVGNERLMKVEGAVLHDCDRCREHVGTVVHVAVDGAYAGHIVIADRVKSDAKAAIAELRGLGVERAVMLTGDHEEVAAHVAAELGIDEYRAGLLPADKVRMVEELLSGIQRASADNTLHQAKLAFLGDGINDAPVLARADVGVAMGALGSDAAIEAADVVLMNDRPSSLALAMRIARRTIGIARQNAWFAIGVKVAVLILATFGLASMGMAVFADVGVMVLAVLNAMRALR